MRHAVVLAGGSGTRLWPASRRALPKQLLPLDKSGEPMIAAAVAIGREVADSVTIVTAESQVDATIDALPGFTGLVIAEPVGRNTAAAIGLAGATITGDDPDAVIAVLPADHHVRDRCAMVRAIDACLAAAQSDDSIALVGIPPTRAETGYGYLEMADGPPEGPRSVLRFVEKPDLVTAEEYLASGRHLWNAGIFCLTARRLLQELEAHLPATAFAVREIAREPSWAATLYPRLTSISFDHGVMEKTDRIVAVPAAVGWSDVGSWAALPEVRGLDRSGNTVVGQGIVIDGGGDIVVADDGTLVAIVGVSGLVVVKSGDAVLVVRREHAQRVREVVEELSKRGLEKYL